MTVDDRTVCPKCIDEPGIADFIEGAATAKKCSFCRRRRTAAFAAPFREVRDFINDRICERYDDPANGLAFESAEGGYQGGTFTSLELLEDELGLEFPEDDGTLLEAIAEGLSNDLWCEGSFYGLNQEDALRFSWERFCRVVKHERRYFFAGADQEDDYEVLRPAETLARLFAYAEDDGLFVTLPSGSMLHRARWTPKGKSFADALQLGPPPVELAVQSNRMSPPGIVMMYASEHAGTALAETASEPGRFTLATFATQRDAVILDISKEFDVPSMFRDVSDSLEYDPRPRRSFLREIARDISKPIARDDKIHVEYVPTQVVTEYLRTMATNDGRKIDGVRYRSSRAGGKTSLVLFATQDSMILPEAIRPPLYFGSDRWIQLVSYKRRRVTKDIIDKWNAADD